MKYLFICLFLCGAPLLTNASVVINEIAWMGNDVSANDEWIELYNDSTQSVDLQGWRLSDGMNLNIELSGVMAAGQYAVLERTDESSAPGTAFILYSGSLVNTGATLSLYRADDSLEDRVVGGEDWGNVGGDNVTKETAQYTTGGWVTGPATPGSANAQEAEEVLDEEESVDDEAGDTHDSSSVTTLHYTPGALHSTIEVPSRVYVHQEVGLSVSSVGLAEGILNALVHDWNFGDLTTGSGEEVSHRFEYPGEYVVTLHSFYKEYEADARHTIVVLPVSFSMTTNAQGDVQVHNDSRYEVDVSGYKIVAGKTLSFPEGTILLPNATITIPKEKLQYTNTATLLDDVATQVATIVPVDPLIREVAVTHVPPVASVAEPVAVLSEDFIFAGDEEVLTVVVSDTQPKVTGAGLVASPIEATGEIPEGKLPYFALLAVIGLGVTAVLAGRVGK